jgi:hypothetical protein
MLDILNAIVSHPYGVIVVFFSLLAAYGFLLFLWGFSGYILSHGNAEHQDHARVQMVQGLSLFIVILSVWEVIRGGILTWNGAGFPTIALTVVVIWIVVWLYFQAKKLFAGGGHH